MPLKTGLCLIENLQQIFIFLAAHCFQNKGIQKKISPEFVVALLGKFDLDVPNESGSQTSLIWDIILHPDWNFNEEKFDADISIAVLTEATQLTNRIHPACLPLPNYEEFNAEGTVVGWGKSNSFSHYDSKPNKLVVPAVNSSHCYTTFYRLGSVSSDRLFCGGYDNQGKAPCLGDSGGGFYHRDPQSRTSWIVGGIVSASLIDFDIGCDINKYSLYTNVARFANWIFNEMEQTKVIIWNYVEFNCKNERNYDM